MSQNTFNNRKEPIFGAFENYPEGYVFKSRNQMLYAKVHMYNGRGISGHPLLGADAIVISGGYVDDFHGLSITYTGQGRNGDQSFESADNKALVISANEKKPVRVFRGGKHLSIPGISKGSYRYEGLFLVTKYWYETDREGTKVCQFLLEKMQKPIPFVQEKPPVYQAPSRQPAPLHVTPKQVAPVREVILISSDTKWHDSIPTDFHQVLAYLEKHQQITEMTLIKFLGGGSKGGRSARKFARTISDWHQHLAFKLEIDQEPEGKIYRKVLK